MMIMANTQATTFQRRVGEVLIAQFSSKLLLNLVFLLTWFWGLFWIVSASESDSSVFFAGLPAMLLVAGAWFTFLNRGFNRK
tara:strand:+ start:107 stop:352 length:246 start_codon:yes stop_codon:yes gene_type:complete